MVKVNFKYETFDLQDCRCEEPSLEFYSIYNSEDEEDSIDIEDVENIEYDSTTYRDCIIVTGVMVLNAEKSDLEGKHWILSAEGSWDDTTTDLDGGLTLNL